MNYFITPKELAKLLEDRTSQDSLVLLDARGSLQNKASLEAYEKGHIKGAYPIGIEDVTGPLHPLGHGGRHPLGELDSFRQTLERFGISNDTTIVIYDNWASLIGRVWFVLRYMGFSNIKVLSGGIERWVREGYPLEKGAVVLPKELGHVNIQLQDNLLYSYEQTRDISKTKEAILIDVRAPRRYRGEVEPLDPVAGHIPSAINVFYEDLFTADGTISVEALKEKLLPIQEDGRDVVVYCGSGITAPIGMLAMEVGGLSSKLYLGSFSDWIAHDDAAIATGEEFLTR